MRKVRASSILLHAGLVLGALIALLPMFWMISASLMPAGQASSYPPRLIPERVTFEHYTALFTRLDLGRYLVNSTLVALTVTLVSLGINSMAGYALAKLRFPGMHNSLVALCKRFKVSLSEREKHGALIDAKLLAADVESNTLSADAIMPATSDTFAGTIPPPEAIPRERGAAGRVDVRRRTPQPPPLPSRQSLSSCAAGSRRSRSQIFSSGGYMAAIGRAISAPMTPASSAPAAKAASTARLDRRIARP